MPDNNTLLTAENIGILSGTRTFRNEDLIICQNYVGCGLAV